MTSEKTRAVLRWTSDPGGRLMTAVISAQQYQDGGKIALVYEDGRCEIAPSLGKRLGDFASFFHVVSHVQGQRPSTTMTVPEALGPSTMSEDATP